MVGQKKGKFTEHRPKVLWCKCCKDLSAQQLKIGPFSHALFRPLSVSGELGVRLCVTIPATIPLTGTQSGHELKEADVCLGLIFTYLEAGTKEVVDVILN